MRKEPRIYNKKSIVSSINEVGNSHCKRMKLVYYLLLYPKINSKSIEDLNVRPGTKKFIEENIEGKLLDMDLRNFFFCI